MIELFASLSAITIFIGMPFVGALLVIYKFTGNLTNSMKYPTRSGMMISFLFYSLGSYWFFASWDELMLFGGCILLLMSLMFFIPIIDVLRVFEKDSLLESLFSSVMLVPAAVTISSLGSIFGL